MLTFSDLVRLLEQKRDLPVKPMDVARLLIEGGVREEIVFVEVDVNARILRGKLVQVETVSDVENYIPQPYAYADCGLISKVYFASKQADDIKVRWSPPIGQFGGFAKLGSGSPQAANLLFSPLRATPAA